MNNSLPQYLFHQGTNFRSYEYFGAHFEKRGHKAGVVFRVWANSAESVSVVGDFNCWNKNANPMNKINDQGVYELFVEGLGQFDAYKFAVTKRKIDVAAEIIDILPQSSFLPYFAESFGVNKINITIGR